MTKLAFLPLSPNSRKETLARGGQEVDGLAPGAEIGPWRKQIGPTERVGPIVLRLFGGRLGQSAQSGVLARPAGGSGGRLGWETKSGRASGRSELAPAGRVG